MIGDLPEERDREQKVTVDIALSIDLRAAARSDKLCDTVDYAALAASVRLALRQARCHMIESAAHCVAAVCLVDPRVSSVRVRVEKPGAVPGLRAAAATVVRERPEEAP